MAGWYPCCDDAASCVNNLCDFAARPNQMVVDLGVGGWVDTVRCDSCDQIAGQYTLDRSGTCEWQYIEDNPCADCGGCTGTGLRITLRIDLGVAANTWRWELCVIMTWASTTDTDGVANSWVTDDEDNTDCFFLGGTGIGDKVELTREANPFSTCGSASGNMCTGDLPDPVYAWEP